MILIDDYEFEAEKLNDLIDFFKKNAFTTVDKKNTVIYEEFLRDCMTLDDELQNEVNVKISNDLISYIKIPSDEADDLSTVELLLKSKDGRKIKKREELIFRECCDKALKNFRGLLDRFE